VLHQAECVASSLVCWPSTVSCIKLSVLAVNSELHQA
jgi:hypothetical protein